MAMLIYDYYMNTTHELTTKAPMLGSESAGNIGKSDSITRLEYRRYVVAPHKGRQVRKLRRSAKRTERTALRAALRAEVQMSVTAIWIG